MLLSAMDCAIHLRYLIRGLPPSADHAMECMHAHVSMQFGGRRALVPRAVQVIMGSNGQV